MCILRSEVARRRTVLREPPSSRLASSDVALYSAGKDNDGFNERPINNVTIDVAKKIKRPRRRLGGDSRKHQTKRRSLGLVFSFNESGN